MADRDLLDYLDESVLNVNHTPNRQLRWGGLSRSRKSSVRKSGKFRMLYTQNKSLDLEENAGSLPQPHSRRIRLSSTSHNATIGDESYINSSFDVVDVTPGISRTQTLLFQSHFNNCTSVSARNIEVVPKSMQQHKTVCDVINKNDMERLSPLPGSLETHADRQDAVTVAEKNIFERRESKSPSVSGITRLQTVETCAMNSKGKTQVYSMDDNSSVITDRMCTRWEETASHTRPNELDHISELTQTIHRTEQIAITQKPLELNDEEDELPATQPVSSILLKGVVAYVEVRSGGDNRSMGIKAHLRSLGATVQNKFTNDVTHVVFNDGLLSTYKKAIKKKVHLVSVSWIEECKKAQTIVSERLYPPYGMEKYESPCVFKRFRKVRSLQPDIEDTGELKIKKRRQKKFVFNTNDNEPEIELPEVLTHKKPIKVPEFLQNASNENALVRTLLSVADIGPEYEKVVNRPDSPTLSEEEDFSIPLAVRLLRKILTPQSSPELASTGEDSADIINRTHMADGLGCVSGAADAQLTPVRKRGQDPQRRSKDVFHNFVSGGNANVKSKIGYASTEICNVNREGNNLCQSSPQSPTCGRSDKVSLTKQRKCLAKNTLSCSRGSRAQNANYGISSEKFQTTTNTANSVENSVSAEDVIMETSDYKSGYHPESTTSESIEVCENQQVDIENLAVGMCSSHSVTMEDQIPNMSSGTGVGKGASVRKRKLFHLLQFDLPEMLSPGVSTVTEETSYLPVQCPYITEEETAGRRKRKALIPVGETSVKTLPPCTPSTSASTTQKHKPGYKKFDSSSNEGHETKSRVPCSSRSSSDEFIRVTEQPLEKEVMPQKMLEKKLPSLVCTSLHRHEVEVVAAVVEKLGGFIVEANVSEKTTHVVTQGPRRTVNLLKGIARGCWIVLQEWVLQSLDANVWLEEDKYELSDFSPAVKHCRMQKQSFGPVYNLDLFSTCGYICVSRDSVPSKRDLEELIMLCGGRIGPSLRSACILVGKAPSARHRHIKCVDEKWVLDSIQFNTLKPLSEYAVL